jgi:hypothetical protein
MSFRRASGQKKRRSTSAFSDKIPAIHDRG